MESTAEIQAAMDEVARYQRELSDALSERDLEKVNHLMGQLAVAERRRNRLLQAEATVASGVDPTPPIREQVIAVLGLLGHPSSVSLIREVSAARFGEVIQTNRLASLRRDEQRSWRAAQRGTGRSQARPTYITPALTFDRFAPVRGILALSSWSLEDRLIGPTSPRADLLRIIIRLADELERGPDTPWAPQLRRLVWRFGRTVASSVPGGAGLTYIQVREAARNELHQIVEADAAERVDAAERARQQHLDPENQLFGSTLRAASSEALG
jgi:hypothetical protein